MRRILGRLLGSREGGAAADGGGRTVHFPEDFRSPSRIAVYSGPADPDPWPALYLARNLQQAFREAELTVVCREPDGWLFGMLGWKPRIVPYAGRPALDAMPDGAGFDGATVFFHPYLTLDAQAASLIGSSGAGIRVSPSEADSPALNVRVRTGCTSYPEVVHRMCAALGIPADRSWRPMIPADLQARVSTLMAPVSGRTLPYIAATTRTVSILERNRAEIPLRTVTLAGKNAEMAALDRETSVAVIAGASAVVTDDAGLWCTAKAMGIPTAGLDPSGGFLPWSGDSPATGEREFVEAWAELLRRGW